MYGFDGNWKSTTNFWYDFQMMHSYLNELRYFFNYHSSQRRRSDATYLYVTVVAISVNFHWFLFLKNVFIPIVTKCMKYLVYGFIVELSHQYSRSNKSKLHEWVIHIFKGTIMHVYSMWFIVSSLKFYDKTNFLFEDCSTNKKENIFRFRLFACVQLH